MKGQESVLRGAALSFVFSVFVIACGADDALRIQLDSYKLQISEAKRNGAVRCAPRELAVAQSHIHFAAIELDQGFPSRAKEHLTIAGVHAQAAYDQSPADRCVEGESAPTKDEPTPTLDDTDGDGIADNLDMCPLEPEDKDAYLDLDGCPELDNDLDGIPDAKDKCPNEPEDPDGFEDDDGCPETDNDKDGVLDSEDQCPNEPGDAAAERKGCPNALVIVTDKEIRIRQQIHFEFNKDNVRKDSYPTLDAVAEVLRKTSTITLEIQGHTDNKGSSDYNQRLSERRATAVMNYLVKTADVAASRLRARGYGLDQPLCANDTTLHRALNRRVQFLRTDTGKAPSSDMRCPP